MCRQKKKKDKELRAKAPKLNKRDREAIRKELKKLDKVGKMSLADLIYFPDDE